MDITNSIKALRGAESLLFILPKEVGNRLNIANHDWLTFEVRNKELVIKKISDVERSMKTNGMREDERGFTLPSYSKDNTVLYSPKSRIQHKIGEKMMLKDSNSNINNNGNKDSDNSSNRGVILQLSKELADANIVSDIRYILEQKILKITFSNSYNNETLSIQGDVKNWFTWTSRIESSIKKRMPKLNNTHRLLIETTISNNIDLLLDSVDNQSKKLKKSNQGQGEEQEQVKKIHLRKYALDGQLYESVVVDKNSKFLTIFTTENSANNENDAGSSNENPENNNNIQFKLIDKIEVPNYEFYPVDSLITHNPIPTHLNQKRS